MSEKTPEVLVSDAMVEAAARSLATLVGGEEAHWQNYSVEARAAIEAALAASKAEAEELVPMFGDYALPRWLLESAARIERYMAANHPCEWVIGGIQSRVEPKAEAKEPSGCSDPDCGCGTPTFTEPMEALRFLSGRFKYAGVGHAVAKSYARDIDAILAKHTAAAGAVPEVTALYQAAANGFHITETCGPDKKYWHVSKFRSMADLHAFDDAWRATMLAAAPSPEQESRNG